jgi:hypothetical protein
MAGAGVTSIPALLLHPSLIGQFAIPSVTLATSRAYKHKFRYQYGGYSLHEVITDDWVFLPLLEFLSVSQTASGLVAWLFPSVRWQNFYFIKKSS